MKISTVKEFFAALRSGPYVWPGGYPVFFVTKDGEALSFKAAKGNAKLIGQAIRDGHDPQWEVTGMDINWEDTELVCADSGELIESAYSND